MKVFTLYFLNLLIFSSAQGSSWTFPLENTILNTKCTNNAGETGVHKLTNDCKTSENEIKGFIRSSGAVVCCKEISKSEEYCSKYGAKTATVIDFHILNGEPSEVGEFPHMAAIGYEGNVDKEISFDCGGSLISEQYVLTAAHCSNLRDRSPKFVRLGTISLETSESSEDDDYEIEEVILPSDYSSRYKYNDIALLKLQRNVTFTKFIKPICLQSKTTTKVELDYTIIGYGVTNADTRVKSKSLLKGQVNGISNENCRDQYKDIKLSSLPQGIRDSQFCALGELRLHGENRGLRTDSCQGDSGSSVMIKRTSDFKLVLYGIVSFGLGCGSALPTLYTRVSEYTQWIENTVWPN